MKTCHTTVHYLLGPKSSNVTVFKIIVSGFYNSFFKQIFVHKLCRIYLENLDIFPLTEMICWQNLWTVQKHPTALHRPLRLWNWLRPSVYLFVRNSPKEWWLTLTSIRNKSKWVLCHHREKKTKKSAWLGVCKFLASEFVSSKRAGCVKSCFLGVRDASSIDCC